MKTSISIYDFSFQFSGYGHYKVTYTSPKTKKSWAKTTDDMELIDATKNESNPKKCDLEKLKRVAKGL